MSLTLRVTALDLLHQVGFPSSRSYVRLRTEGMSEESSGAAYPVENCGSPAVWTSARPQARKHLAGIGYRALTEENSLAEQWGIIIGPWPP
jgi:hypothetical protein